MATKNHEMSSSHACSVTTITCLCVIVLPLLLCNFCFARKSPADHVAVENRAWLKWKEENNKTYGEDEEPERRANWAAKYHNYKSLKKQKAFTKGFTNENGETEFPVGAGGPNGLADLSEDELESLTDDLAEMTEEDWRELEASDFHRVIDFDDERAGIELEDNLEESSGAAGADAPAAERHQRLRRDANGEGHLDWRTKGLVSPVINQGNCHSCWAIAVAGAVEAAVKKAKGKPLVALSPQMILECEGKWQGCKSRTNVQAGLNYVSYHGLGSSAQFPYRQPKSTRTCPEKGSYKNEVIPLGALPVRLVGSHVDKGNEEKLKRAVRLCGPVIASIHVSKALTAYTKNDGIYAADKECEGPGAKNSHAMLIVGYGTDPTSKQDYWLIKNSWGHWWGHDGYLKLARNKNNFCGIANEAIWVANGEEACRVYYEHVYEKAPR